MIRIASGGVFMLKNARQSYVTKSAENGMPVTGKIQERLELFTLNLMGSLQFPGKKYITF